MLVEFIIDGTIGSSAVSFKLLRFHVLIYCYVYELNLQRYSTMSAAPEPMRRASSVWLSQNSSKIGLPSSHDAHASRRPSATSSSHQREDVQAKTVYARTGTNLSTTHDT